MTERMEDMKNGAILYLLIVLNVAGCNVRQQNKNEVTREGVTVTTEQITNPQNFRYKKVTYARDSEPYKELGFLDNGNRLYEVYYARVDTERIMTHIQYFPDGELSTVSVLDGNRLICRYVFYPNGKIQWRQHGLSNVGESWYADGMKQSIVEYAGLTPKRVTNWHHNGIMSEQSEWKNDQRHGKWFQWDSLGNQTRKEFYAMGRLLQ